MRRLNPSAALVAVLALLLAAPGCGEGEPRSASSEEADVAGSLEGFVTAIRDGDGDAACERLASETLDDLEASGSCETVLAAGIALLGEQGVEIPDYEVTDVTVTEDRAEATLAGATGPRPISLVRESGEWVLLGTTALSQIHPDSPLDSDSGIGEVGG